jgi:CheY-like chemotaxis protein
VATKAAYLGGVAGMELNVHGGTTAWFTVPLAPPELSRLSTSNTSGLSQSSEPNASSTTSSTPRRTMLGGRLCPILRLPHVQTRRFARKSRVQDCPVQDDATTSSHVFEPVFTVTRAGRPSRTEGLVPTPGQLHVLVTDDSRLITRLVSSALIQLGVGEVVMAGSAEDAQLLLYERIAVGTPGFDLLIVDREMDGGMDGIALTRLIRMAQHEGRLPRMYVVLLTGHTREYVMSGDPVASELFDAILEKPMGNASLARLVKQVQQRSFPHVLSGNEIKEHALRGQSLREAAYGV